MEAAEDARWLNDEEQEAWRGLLAVSRLLYSQVERELLADSGLTMAQYAILALLSENPDGVLRMGDVAEATQSLPSSLSHAAGRLEEAGWIERTHCPSDRRSWLASITPAGRAVLEAAAPAHVETVRHLVFDRLEAFQVSELRAITSSILEGLVGDNGGETCPVG